MAENRKKRRGALVIILAALAALALLLVAAAATGYHTGIAWLDGMFAAGGGNVSAAGGGTEGAATAGNGCFLGIVCLDANGSANANDQSQGFSAVANDSGAGVGQ